MTSNQPTTSWALTAAITVIAVIGLTIVVLVAVAAMRFSEGSGLSFLKGFFDQIDRPKIGVGDLNYGVMPSGMEPPRTQHGLIVCEPAVPSDSSDIAEFTSGCGDWLNFTVGGVPQFGSTPTWRADDRAVWELHRRDLRLGLSDAAKLQQMTGADLVAVGTAAGTSSSMKIIYRVYRLPSEEPVGHSIELTGSEQQIAAHLNAASCQLEQTLHISPYPVRQAGLSPKQLDLCAGIRWTSGHISEPDQGLLLGAAEGSPYAAFLAMSHIKSFAGLSSEKVIRELLIDKLGDNPTALAEVGYLNPDELSRYQPLLKSSLHKFPFNYQLNYCKVRMDGESNDLTSELNDSKTMVSCAPHNADAWSTFAHTMSDVDQGYRKGRYYSQMSSEDAKAADAYLRYWIGVSEQAVKLDPLNGHTWLRLSQAAAFESRREALGSLNQALALGAPADRIEAYGWAFALCDNRWFGNTRLRDSYADQLLKDPTVDPADLLTTVDDMMDTDDQTQHDHIINTAIARAQDDAVSHPYDPAPHIVEADGYGMLDRLHSAATQYGIASALRPSDPNYHYQYGYALKVGGRLSDAIEQFNAAIKLNPSYSDAYALRGMCYSELKSYPDALLSLQSALNQEPRNITALLGLAETYNAMKKYASAEAAAKAGLRVHPYDDTCWEVLVNSLDTDGKYQEAISDAKVALTYSDVTDDARIRNTMADAYIHAGEPDESLRVSEQSLEIDPNDQWAHENKAEAYLSEGQRSNAVKEWREVVYSGNSEMATVARRYLEKYNDSST